MGNPEVITHALVPTDKLTANLKRLMHAQNLSEAELSRRTGIPQATLHKVVSGKTTDPRTSTLLVLANFFKISLDTLIYDYVLGDPHRAPSKTQPIPIISWSECLDATNFIESLSPASWSNWVVTGVIASHAYGLISKPSMEPCFPKGSVLVINPEMPPSDGDIVVVHFPNADEATLRELSTDGPIKYLLPINEDTPATRVPLDKTIRIVGVVIQSIYAFHSS